MHLKGFSPECVRMWLRKLLIWENIFGQKLHSSDLKWLVVVTHVSSSSLLLLTQQPALLPPLSATSSMPCNASVESGTVVSSSSSPLIKCWRELSSGSGIGSDRISDIGLCFSSLLSTSSRLLFAFQLSLRWYVLPQNSNCFHID